MSIIVRNMARVQLPNDFELKALILGMFSYTNSSTGEQFSNYVYRDGVCWLPPNMDKLRMIAGLLGEELVDMRHEGSPLREPFLLQDKGFKLRPYQEVPARLLLEHTLKHNYSTLSAGTGLGKTYLLTYVAGHLGGKILTLLDQGNLVEGWQEASKFIWGKDAQVVKAKDTEFSDVCIATFQLLAKTESILKAVRNEFSVCLVDEAHTSAATTYRRVLSTLNNKYRIGCSASYFRKGFSSQVLSDYLAPVSVVMENSNAVIPTIAFKDSGVMWCSTNPRDYATRILPELAINMQRNAFIFSLIKEGFSNKRVIAVLCITIKQATFLYELTKRLGARTILYVGTTSLKRDKEVSTLIETKKVDVVFIVSKASKGTNWPNLDMMILAKPNNSERDAIQIVGRLSRFVEGKPEPIAFDIRDSGSLSECFARNREKYYRKIGYKILGTS